MAILLNLVKNQLFVFCSQPGRRPLHITQNAADHLHNGSGRLRHIFVSRRHSRLYEHRKPRVRIAMLLSYGS